MRKLVALAAMTAAFTLVGSPARALRPDYDGEHGIEAAFGVGYGSFGSTTERLFWTQSEAAGITSPPNAISGGAALHFALGYRFTRFLSAGLSAQAVFIGTSPIVHGGANYPTSGNAFAFGLYVRFYPMPLLNHTADVPRVRFDNVGDLRRIDPWISVGFEFAQVLSRTETATNSPYYSTWRRHSVGVPVAIGLDVRLIPGLAVGIGGGVAPWLGGGVDQYTHDVNRTGNDMNTASLYASVDDTNLAWFVTLDARYTFSL